MANEAQKKAFIAEVAPLAQKAYLTLGKILPSVCIGMACVESGFGYGSGTRLMYRHNACWGQKVGTGKTAKKYWSGKFFTSKTSEEYTVGVHTIITSAFRAYDTLEQGCFNYYELLNTSLYKKVKSGVNYIVQMQQIKECGYMTSSKEVNSVIQVIQKYNLTQYDKVVGNPASPVNASEYYYKPNEIYTTQQDLYVRDNPNGNKIKFEALTDNAKEHAKKDLFGYAILERETRVTCKGIRTSGSCTWMKIPSGYICAQNSKHIYIL